MKAQVSLSIRLGRLARAFAAGSNMEVDDQILERQPLCLIMSD